MKRTWKSVSRAIGLVLLLATAVVVQPVRAESTFPDRPIRLIVPYPPGGPVDIVGRIISAKLGAVLGQSIVVVNRGGADGNIGAQQVATAKPDGYTLLMGSAGPLAVNPAIYSSMPFDASKDFTPIGLVGKVPQVLVVNPSLNITTFAQLIAYAKANPGKLTFASSGIGSMQFVAGELFKERAKIDIQHIPYQGAAPALVDLISGRVNMMIDLMPTSKPYIKSGQLRAIAVTTSKRLAGFPDVPTLQECGLKDFDVGSWFGLVAPAGTPEPVIAKLQGAIARLAADPAFKDALAKQGVQADFQNPTGFASFIKSEQTRWAQVMKEANVEKH
jgi:tripartite-type tricarboxylate transporter receptor subunit TctC